MRRVAKGTWKDDVLSQDFPPFGIIEDWPTWLREPDKKEDIEILRRNTYKGLPCSNESFVSKLETILNRSLRFRPRGRPKKVRSEEA